MGSGGTVAHGRKLKKIKNLNRAFEFLLARRRSSAEV
jgi:hypothetical protein